MAYPKHAKLVFGGSFGEPSQKYEEWSCSINLRTQNSIAQDTDAGKDVCDEYLRDVVKPALEAWFTNSDTRISGYAKLQWAKVNAIGPDGKYLHDETVETHFTDVQGGAGSAVQPMYPNQVSLVVSLETGKNSGKALRGRFYLPSPAITLNGTGLFNSDQIDECLATTKTFLNALNASQSHNLELTYFQPAVVSKLAGGVLNVVTAISMDNRFDVQRSRAAQLEPVRLRVPLEDA